jgi:hypothetical protein
MKYRILLPEGHSAKKEQTIKCVSGKLYLKNGFGREIPALFGIGDARKKSILFNANIEASPSKYDVIEDYTVAQVSIDKIPMNVIIALESCCSFVDKDKSLGEKLYSVGSLGEDLIPNATGELKEELLNLYEYVVNYMYVTFTKC